ncbi:MAG: caspase family protein [Amaricoccus sp.]
MRPIPPASIFTTIVAAALVLLLGGPVRAAGTPATDEAPGNRVALVIGNGAYGELGTLPNPPNDAGDIADELEKLDFKVTRVIDGNADAMRRALRDFGSSATGADVALFYYAGHGMALRGENYLVPVQAHIENELDLRYETLALSDVQDALNFSDAHLKMVILDACRDNPLAKMLQSKEVASGRGLSLSDGLVAMQVQDASGMFIAYSTAPGSVALDGSNQRNSPFTKALLTHIATPNTDVSVMFRDVRADVVKATNGRQTPWTEEAMLGGFEFNPQAIEPPPPVTPDYITAWNKIAKSEDPADFENFVKQFPDSPLVDAANARLNYLRDPATEAAAWDKLKGSSDVAAYETFLHRYPNGTFSSAALITLQGMLSGQLANSGDIAGMQAFIARFPTGPFTPFVRGAMERVQAAQANEAPAAPTTSASLPAAPPVAAAQPAPAAAPAPADATQMAMATAAPTADADGGQIGRALTLVEPPSDTPEVTTALNGLPPEADLSPASVRRLNGMMKNYYLQNALKALDYYHGGVDDKFGPGSQRAASDFQRAIGTEPTGDLQPAEIVMLISRAAKAGDAFSQNALGGMFEFGAGVLQDPSAAAKWYRAAADNGDAYAPTNLARLQARQ